MVNNYTNIMEDSLFDKWGSELNGEEECLENIIRYLNSSDFRTFGEGLEYLISKRIKDNEKAIDCLYRLGKEKNIDIVKELASVNTLKSWFSGGERPKKGEDSRRKMFVLSFVLGLTQEETLYLFQRVFLDRAFNPRNAKEVIYYYCINNGKPLTLAEQMIGKIKVDDSIQADETIFTKLIASELNEIREDTKIVEYINSHPHNFAIGSLTAKQKVHEYLDRAKKYARDEAEKPEFEGYYVGKNKESINFVYEVITDQSVTSEKGTKTIFKNSELPKEIKNSFPEAVTFSKKEPTYDELRKMLILLFSYCFWSEASKNSNVTADIDDYTYQLDDLLEECGLPTIYPGNPFDWLFCFCTISDIPLDMFRGILAEVLPDNQ